MLPASSMPSSALTSSRWPTSTNAQVGWKAPVPQASKWVWLYAWSSFTKFMHSVWWAGWGGAGNQAKDLQFTRGTPTSSSLLH